MLKFARRLHSQLVKQGELSSQVTKVTAKKSGYYEYSNALLIVHRIQDYQNTSLKAYFEENALLFPVETIIGKRLNFIRFYREDSIEGLSVLPRTIEFPQGCRHPREV
jgi:hypothetical protein